MGSEWHKRDGGRPKSASHAGLEAEIAEISSRQKRLIRLDQLKGLGLTRRGVAHRVASGSLYRLHAGVFATHPPPHSHQQRYLAAVYACGEYASLIGPPSAWLYGCLESPPLIAEVNSPTGRGRSRPGVNVRRKTIASHDLRTHHGIPTTTMARTILDCAHALGEEGTEDLIMAADSKRILNRRRLEELTVEHAGQPGVRHILSLIAETPRELRSKNERRMFGICRAHAIPLPLTNHRIETAGRTFYADFLWPERKLIVEADSWRWHGGRRANESDKDRDQLLAIAGYLVVHFTRDQILKARGETGRRLAALAAA
jgi:very-short-patch-repair endonuclease